MFVWEVVENVKVNYLNFIKINILNIIYLIKVTFIKCSENVCTNGGTCLNDTNSHKTDKIFRFKCLCPNGFKGDLCEIEIPNLIAN